MYHFGRCYGGADELESAFLQSAPSHCIDFTSSLPRNAVHASEHPKHEVSRPLFANYAPLQP